MSKLFRILTILLFINGNFASDEKTLFQDTNKTESNFTERMVSQTLNSTNKELLEDVLKEVESSTEYIVKVTSTMASAQSESQHSNLGKSELVNLVLNNVTNLDTNQENIKFNATNLTEHLIKVASEELQTSNITETGAAQINCKTSAKTAENSTDSLFEETSIAFSVNTTNPLITRRESQNSSLPERELDGKKLPDLLNIQREIMASSHPLNSVSNIEHVSKDLKHFAIRPEMKKDNEETASKPFSSSHSTDSAVLQIVLQEQENSANNQNRDESVGKNSTHDHEANKTILDRLEPTETRNQPDADLAYKEAPLLSGNNEVTKIIAGHGIAAKPTNTLNMIQNTNFTAAEKDLSEKEVERKQTAANSSESLNFTNPTNSLYISRNPNLSQSVLVSNKPEGIVKSTADSEELLSDKESTALNEYTVATKPLNSFELSENLNMTESVLLRIVLKDARNLTENSLQSSFADAAASQSISKPSNSQQQSQNSHSSDRYLAPVDLKDAANLTGKSGNSWESALEVDTTTQYVISLEEYAVRQMNYILDHLLWETQEFVANVLQASLNSVFPRDNLKRYAEALNHVLSPVNDADSSEYKPITPDQIYEEIMRKLNFLKSKPSKYLQKNLPQEWLNDFRAKKAETAIWLDKATYEMHQELNTYISEEEDHIKYQYFNESFDDMSRATEIHQKLALLADLVKIIKNKKQITFTDLYMQT